MKYENTGLYSYCFNLGNHLKKFIRPATESLDFYSPKSVRDILGNDSNTVLQASFHKLFLPSLKDYDIWHATNQDSYYVPFRNKKIKVVLTIHDLNFLYNDSKPAWKKQKYLRHVQKLINRADAIICPSEYSKKDVLQHCNINNKPVYVIHNGTNFLQLPALSSESYKPARPFIFSIGAVTLLKNFHSLLPLVNDTDMELIIAGRIEDSDYFQFILSTAEKMGIKEKINIIGEVSENEKSWYFNNCYAFASPSKAEGFGLPVAEAMSVGKPLFLANHACLPEIGGNVAFYFNDFADTCMQETFISGMKSYIKFNMQNDIIIKGKEFCWDIAAKEYLKIYRLLY